MRVAILSLFTTIFLAVAQFFPLSLYSVTSLTTLTKRALADYTPVLFSSSPVSSSPLDDGSATFLPDIIQAATRTCQPKCHVVSRTLAGCLRSGADYDILKCSCSDTTLARVYTCANCITIDASNPNGTLPLQNYNAFVNQCISLSLSNSSQLYQIRGQPLTIAHATTTLTNPSATMSGGGGVPGETLSPVAGAGGDEFDDDGIVAEEEGEIDQDEMDSSAVTSAGVRARAGRRRSALIGTLLGGRGVFVVVAVGVGCLLLL